MKKYFVFLFFLFILVFILFHNAVKVSFFSDDFSFLQLSRIHTLKQFLTFFVPGKSYFFRPIPTEVFYFLLNTVGKNTYIGHAIAFIFFFVGLTYLYKILNKITKNNVFALFTIFFYGTHLTHVFQLYSFATFQEIALFTFLSASFYYFILRKPYVSLAFFICALLSKETAVVYPLFLAIWIFFDTNQLGKRWKSILGFVCLSVVFMLFYTQNLQHVTQDPLYKIQLNPRLIVNNAAWYLLWGIGFPSNMPFYVSSILKPYSREFLGLFAIYDFKIYFTALVTFLIFMVLSTIYIAKKIKNSIYTVAFLALCYFVFLILALPILHKWPVRLTVPEIFVSILCACVSYTLAKKRTRIANILLIGTILFYSVTTVYGIRYHEQSSLYFMETRIVHNADKYFASIAPKIQTGQVIYFKDDANFVDKPLDNSQKLFTTFSDQAFLDYYFPGKNLKAYYAYNTAAVPPGAYIINSAVLLK